MKNYVLALPDHQRRKEIREILGSDPNLDLLQEGEDLKDLVYMLESGLRPELAIVFLASQIELELALLKAITSKFRNVKVLCFGDTCNDAAIQKAFSAGIHGYLMKDVSRSELLFAAQHVMAGKEVLCSSLAVALVKKASQAPVETPSPILTNLTAREREVLLMIAEGYTNKEIAEKTFTSKRTVEGHRSNLLEKLGARNTAQLIRYAFTQRVLT
ncbi:response regulator transcription factor [Pedobacter sp. SYSU D00535]|uniref:LuxR C-terminal-related transcriptional regulator n=1 Tax=Pedobacter sp. SYSU D00535 TaxID=2810308 RepID=UPI001A95DE7B|nr:response regulator transcription factor [Pedobacter sp. SYSU D00535]